MMVTPTAQQEAPSMTTPEGPKDAARQIAKWAAQLASEYEALAVAEIEPGAGPLTEEQIGQKMQSHDQFIGAAAAMRAMIEKIEGEFSL
jgi:hypothetical protein